MDNKTVLPISDAAYITLECLNVCSVCYISEYVDQSDSRYGRIEPNSAQELLERGFAQISNKGRVYATESGKALYLSMRDEETRDLYQGDIDGYWSVSFDLPNELAKEAGMLGVLNNATLIKALQAAIAEIKQSRANPKLPLDTNTD